MSDLIHRAALRRHIIETTPREEREGLPIVSIGFAIGGLFLALLQLL